MPEEDKATFVTKLQSLGITLEAYNGAYNNQESNHAVEDKRKYEAYSSETPNKKRKTDEDQQLASTSNSNSEWTTIVNEKERLSGWTKTMAI